MGKSTRVRTFAATMACAAATMSLGAGAGEAAAPPAASGGASSVTSTSARLNGTVDPGGIATAWVFQYGTSATYGQYTAPVGPLTGTSPMSVSTLITGLRPQTTYHYRLVAVQGGYPQMGYTGDGMTFKTLAKGAHAKASLRSRTLVVRHGAALIPYRCSGPQGTTCNGTISLSARGKLRKVNCGTGTFRASAGKHRTVHAALGHRCLMLVKAASRHRLRASLKAVFSQGTGSPRTRVTLVGAGG